MRIAAVDVFAYDLTYVHGRYVMSGGRVIERLSSTVVRIRTDDGIEGFGEVCPLGPAYLPGHAGGARAALAELAPAVIGLTVGSLGPCTRRARPRARRPRLREERARPRLLGRARPHARAPPLRPSRRPPAGAVPALRRDPARPGGRDGGECRRTPGGGHPPLPAQARRRPAPPTPSARAPSSRPPGAEDLVVADANGGWRVAGRRRRRPGARGASARLPRAALPDLRGVPPGAPADDDADGARRVDPGMSPTCCAGTARRRWRRSTSSSRRSAGSPRRG